MKLFSLAALLATLAVGTTIPPEAAGPQYIFANPDDVVATANGLRIPTSRESAVLARRVLALTPHGVLSTVFPSGGGAVVPENAARPESLAGMPVGLMDYVADCEDSSGNPTILAINIATSFRNVRAGSNISLALSWTPKYLPDKRIELAAYVPSWLDNWLPASWRRWLEADEEGEGGARTKFSAANLPRFSLLGYLEAVPGADRESAVANCFVATHPDARYWLPGNRIHESKFVRLVVTGVYWIGGFGDRAYIGWIPAEEWRDVTREEWQAVRLPGEEKGWREWAAERMAWGEL